ncbi:hypothetical protein HGRIS_012779 [Hohenbuehelia grisea]|uniref:Transcription elongation factor Spt6 n=1 Tax=Hohenbuehelia grisea TaxID=104357 RepID=A0ABR3ITF5_9AGAR
MSSPQPDLAHPVPQPVDGDVPMDAPNAEQDDDEGEGDVVMPGVSDDSSEEAEEDEEEERRIRDGFIVDEEEEEEEEEDDDERRRRHKRRKKHHRKRRREDSLDLEDDDLELLEENTGASFRKNRLTRLRRAGRSSDSPPAASSSKRAIVESSDDDLDDGVRQEHDIKNIWDDQARDDDDEGDIDGMDDFIDYDEEDESGQPMDEEAREERRRERRKQERERRKIQGIRPELAGIDANAWDEIHDVFGDGHEYDWALAGDDEIEYDEEQLKPEMKYQDVFEPSEIQARMLTEDDDLIRVQDIPERMQLATSTLSTTTSLAQNIVMEESDLAEAALWVTTRISSSKTQEFFTPMGSYQHMRTALVMAVTYALKAFFIEFYEVPYVWTHKRDYISHFDPDDIRARLELLTLEELWKIYALGLKYRSLLQRQRSLLTAYQRLQVQDEYYEAEIQPKIDSVEVVADATEWLTMKYKDKKAASGFDFHFHDDEEQPETATKRKMPTRISAYEVAKKSVVSKLAQGFGIQSQHVVLNFIANNTTHFLEDQELNPIAFAEQYADPDPAKAAPPEELLRRARLIIATELGKDPLLRRAMRDVFKAEALIDIHPTERGVAKIDEYNTYHNFKYLQRKPVADMLDSSQFLFILTAEQELLVNVSIYIPPEIKAKFEAQLTDAFRSDGFSDTAKAWNVERIKIVSEVMEHHLIPAAVKWTREYIRETVEEHLALQCAQTLRERIDVAPYQTPQMQRGETPNVLAVSWGKGDPHKDAITVVFFDDAGRMRDLTKIDNLHDEEPKDEFLDIVRRRKPDVVVVGGFTMATTKLSQRLKAVLKELDGPNAIDVDGQPSTPVTYIHDDVARIFQHSKRAEDEFPSLSPTAKYCVGLARYVQSPLTEFAALGRDIVAIELDTRHVQHVEVEELNSLSCKRYQHLIPTEKLLTACERVIVDVVNKVGVDINRAVTDAYYQHLLPFVCGLGPRKSQVVVKKIAALGGNLTNRDQFIKGGGILTTKIFMNASGFLRILSDMDCKPTKHRHNDEDAPDPLDNTRIHPEDYELARKMATDALELDEEDINDEHPSHVVAMIMQDPERDKKLSELNLDEFAVSLYQANSDQKRHILNVIRDELRAPFSELRETFVLPTAWDVLTMLSGETRQTLRVGLIITTQVARPTKDVIYVRTASGIDGEIEGRLIDRNGRLQKQEQLQAIIIGVKINTESDSFVIDLTAQSAHLAGGDSAFRRVQPDKAWDYPQEIKDREMLARKKRAEIDRSRRVIKHPNFHNFNSGQAEAYLDKMQRGDVVIRPSSKGFDHLAVTWKVDDKVYQHIDVVEPNADPTGQTTGGQLIVDATHSYADLDELIVNHVQSMARKVEELMAHERFKHGSEDELHLFLKNHLAANPGKSMYGFSLNRKRPGHFNLCFLANKNSAVQTWPVRVTPEAYHLFDATAVGVPELCDAFKVRHLHESQNAANQATGGKTPFGAGGRTPARTPARPGHATPGHMSVRQPARTPNPYGGGATPFGGAPPPNSFQHPQVPAYGTPAHGGYPGGTPAQYGGYQTPSHPPFAPVPPGPAAAPAGMNPERAAMIQNAGGWGSNNGWQ